MQAVLKLISFRRTGEKIATVTISNPTLREFGPGGVRFLGQTGKSLFGGTHTQNRFSGAYFWPIAPGDNAEVQVPVSATFELVHKVCGEFAYVELNGAVHPIDGIVSLGAFGGPKITHTQES
jgi:hypothetical protein